MSDELSSGNNGLRYAGIIDCDLLNGDGIGVTLFTQGCTHHCKGCQNPQTWNKNCGVKFTKKTFDDLFKKLDNPIIDHLSLSGGDPLDNIALTLLVLKEFRKRYSNNKRVWLWTGYTWEEIMNSREKTKAILGVDYLIDGEFKEDKKDLTLKLRGSSNQRIIDVKESLKQNKIITIE